MCLPVEYASFKERIQISYGSVKMRISSSRRKHAWFYSLTYLELVYQSVRRKWNSQQIYWTFYILLPIKNIALNIKSLVDIINLIDEHLICFSKQIMNSAYEQLIDIHCLYMCRSQKALNVITLKELGI